MKQSIMKARRLLDTGDYTCVVCRGDAVYTTTERGVKPLVNWLDADLDFQGFVAADRVVGRVTAFLYCLLGVTYVYSQVMSRPAAQVLGEHGICYDAGLLVDGIINRRKTGPCPFEKAVMAIQDPQEAFQAIREKLAKM